MDYNAYEGVYLYTCRFGNSNGSRIVLHIKQAPNRQYYKASNAGIVESFGYRQLTIDTDVLLSLIEKGVYRKIMTFDEYHHLSTSMWNKYYPYSTLPKEGVA